MSVRSSVAGYTELSDWIATPIHPVSITQFGRYRDGGPQGGTFYIDLEDAKGDKISFFFDKFLGRLCFGSTTETGEDAAFIKFGSRIEKEAFILIESLAKSSGEYEEIL